MSTTIHDLWALYHTYTKEMSKQLRQLSFVGAAICWAYKISNATTSSGTIELPEPINWAMLLFVVFFITDILQYFTGALLHRFWLMRVEEKLCYEKDSEGEDCSKPRWLDYPAFSLFLLKTTTVLIAFLLIAKFLLALT